MKKQIPILIVLLLFKFSSISQTASNSDSITCIPNSQLKKAINIIETGKVVKAELNATKAKVSIQDSLLTIKDSIIIKYQKKELITSSQIEGYKMAVDNYKKSLANAELTYGIQSLKLAKQKAKKWIALAIGFGAGFLVFH